MLPPSLKKDDPKLIVGYSDVTALLLGIYQRTGLITYYGPAVVASFGEFPPFVDTTCDSFLKLAMGGVSLPYDYPRPAVWTEEFVDWNTQTGGKTPRDNRWVTLREGAAEGPLLGGNLNTIEGVWGSPYMPEIREGDLLLLEDSLKDAATVERSFSHLRLCGIFDRIGGFILGKHELFDDAGSGRGPAEILREIIGEVSFPILAEFDCCHTHPMLTLPLGCKIRLDATNQRVTLLEACVG